MRRIFNHSLLFTAALVLVACGGGGGGGATTSTGGSGSGVTVGVVSTANASANQTTVIKPGTAGAGAAYIWGDNTWGQIGDGTQNSPKPTPTAIGGSSTWKAVAAGGSHTLAIKADGTLWAWGLCVNGQLGLGVQGASCFRTVPTKVGVAADWTAVSAGDAHSLAIENGKIMAWGQGTNGKLGVAGGTGTTCTANNNQDQTIPTQLRCFFPYGSATLPTTAPLATAPSLGSASWRSIAAGGNHSMALLSTGVLYSWGSDSAGQLGQLTGTSNPGIPTGVNQPAGFTYVVAISAGSNHSLAIEQGGSIYSWGDNTSGQLGRSTGTTAGPAPIVEAGPWIAVAAGGSHSLGIKQDLSLWAWGSNAYGQLGNNTATDSAVPVQVGGTTRFNKVSAGLNHSVAIDTNGNLWVWGRNDSGQLGTGATSVPVLVPALLP
jgi:alpha-tubulin suppressor-like RCC1 family protein